MASSPDDEENRTLGLPPGALEKILRDKEREKSRDRERLAAAPPGKPSSGEPVARPQPPPRTPPSNTAPAAPKWDPLDDGGSDMRTIPPARTGRNRREIPSLDAWRDSQELSPPPQGPPSKLDAPEAFQGTGPSQARPPLGPGWPSADTGQSLPSGKWPEREGLETALLPHQKKPLRAEVPSSPTRGADFPLPDPWGGAPSAGPAPQAKSPSPATKSPSAKTDTSTPVRYSGTRQAGPAPPVTTPNRRPASPRAPIENEGMTVGYDRPVRSLQRVVLILQFYNVDVHRWSDLGKVRPEGQVIGRVTFTDWESNAVSLAEEHLRLSFEGDELLMEPLPSLNGAYLKLRAHQPVELEPHNRFWVGRHVLEYRPGGPPGSMTPMCSEDGEVFQSRVLVPRGFVDLIGLDQEPYVSFPLTKDTTRIGREGPECDIALSGDD